MGHSIVVGSGKGGVGKTNVVINLGVALAKIGKRVAIIDGSLTTPDISLHLKIPFNVMGLAHILKGKADIESASFMHSSGVRIIPGNVHIDVLKEIQGRKFARVLKDLKKEHDFVLVDASAGLGIETMSAMKNCDKMLIITNPEMASIVNSSKAIQIAKSLKVRPMGVILNRVGRFIGEYGEKQITPLLHNVPIIGKISEDRRLPMSAYYSQSVLDAYPNSKASREFYNIAYRLANIDERAKEPLFEKFISFFKKNP